MKDVLGKEVDVVVDRAIGSVHPTHPDIVYSLNYGYVPGVWAGDGEEQDAYVMGVREKISRFHGRVIAVIHRLDDNEDKWVVAPAGEMFAKDEIRRATWFVERYFTSEIEVYHG